MAVLLVLGGAAYGISLLAGGDDKNNGANTLASPQPTASAPPGGCAYTKAGTPPKGKTIAQPTTTAVDKTHTYTTTMKTNRGTVTFDMFGG
jgi:hypothetical protein